MYLNLLIFKNVSTKTYEVFSADRTNGRTYATMLRTFVVCRL